MDFNQRMPIHYAAGCEFQDNLKLILEKGGTANSIDFFKATPLIYAARAGYPDNVVFLLKTAPHTLNMRDRYKMTALGYAC
jgi:ankyrin repeat protein